MDNNAIYTTLLPHCKSGYERTLYVYVQFCVTHSQPNNAPGCENHHILPKSLFPEYRNVTQFPWNNSRLLYQDHLKAHKMLSRCLGGSMTYALWRMMNNPTSGYYVSLQEYEVARNAFCIAISNHLKDIPRSAGTRQKIKEAQIGKHVSSETRYKLSESHKGNQPSIETRRKMSESGKGNQNALGTKHTKETRRKWSRLRTGMVRSEQSRQNMSNAKKNEPQVTCPHCKKKGANAAMRRWHFDNCRNV